MKNQTGNFAKISLIILLGMFLTCLHSTSAFAVDFITKKEFEAQKSPYQDYPLKILFKKLAESDASEKKMIRNTIILKQVFDRNIQEKIKAGLINYQETFGTISNISNDNLELWLPKTDSSISFYLGIDRIPLVNDHNYEILESNINKYAAVIYSLDNRVYQIKISFLPTAPDGLYMQRENDKNIVGWKRPATAREPVGYKLFINEELFGQVKETHAKVLRTSGQVDEYYVKAVYKHGDSLIESDASDIQTDEITAKEIQQEILAWETYDRIVAALNPSEWQTAEKLLYDNQPFLSENLDQERQQNTALLVAFFKDIDAGDQLIQATPISIKSSESALSSYQSAAQKAKSLPTGLDVEFIPRLKIDAGKEQIARLQTEQKQLAAGQTYDRIVAALNPSEWQTAEKLLYDNQQFLSENLDQERRQKTALLAAFFKDIDAGDRLGQAAPASIKSIESALMFYQSAEKKAKSLPTGLDVEFIPRLKIDAGKEQIARLQTEQKQLAAGQTYDRIVAALNPSEWQTAEKLLYDNQPFLSENLDQERQQNTALLVAFFKDIDAGDRLIQVTPVSIKSSESALSSYQSAATKAQALPTAIDVEFIHRLKIDESQKQIARLQTEQKQRAADQTYDRIVAALNPSDWQTAEKLLYGNQQFLSQHLDEERKQNTAGLIDYFREIDEGDRFSTTTPASINNIESALMFYQRAATKAQALPTAIDVEFIHRLKINGSQEHLARLQTQQKELAAGQTYDRIITDLNPSQWQTAEKLLYDNQQFLSRHLAGERIQNTLGLIAFFREIDAGDRFSATAPASVQNLESALMFYQRAATKAQALPAAIDVEFIYRLKIDESQKLLAKLQAPEQEFAAARNARTAAVVATAKPAAPEEIVDRKTALEGAMKNFKTRDYTSSLNHFEKVYSTQIASLKRSENKSIRGLLSLPVRHRAEVIFLLELDRLKKENEGNEDLVKEGLEILYESVDNGEGPWSITPASKRRKIKRHIEKYVE